MYIPIHLCVRCLPASMLRRYAKLTYVRKHFSGNPQFIGYNWSRTGAVGVSLVVRLRESELALGSGTVPSTPAYLSVLFVYSCNVVVHHSSF